MNVPKLRFKEFNDEWKNICLKDVFEYYSTNSLSREQLSSEGIIKNIHYGDIHKKFSSIVNVEKNVDTYIKDINYKNKYELCKNNDLIFADASEDYVGIGKAIELINVNCTTISGLHTILARDCKNVFAPKFKGYYFNSPKVHNQIRILANGFKVFGISKDTINKLEVNIPTVNEQIKIANTLELLDKKIELQTKKIEDLKLFKKGLNDSIIFKKIGVNLEINTLITEYNKKTTTNNQYPVLSSTMNGITTQQDYFNKSASSSDTTGYKIIPKNYITYRSMSDTGQFYFNLQNIIDIGIVSPAYPVFKLNSNINLEYFLNYINNCKKFRNQILSIKEGGTRFALSFTKFSQLLINIPEENYMNLFGEILTTINTKLQLEAAKLDKLQQLKKGLMQNMFV